jgi:hypothetical protein
MQTEATSHTAVQPPCSHCGAALPEHVAVCPQCGAHVLLEVLPAAEIVPPPTLLPARILRPKPTTLDQAGNILSAPPRLAQNDLNGARRWGMSRGAAILLFGFAIAFGTYVSITQRDVALVKWQKVLFHNEPSTMPAGSASNQPQRSSVPLVALLEREIEKSRAEDARDEQLAQNDLNKANAAKSAAPAPAAAAPVTPARQAKPKAAASVASAAQNREHVSEPRKTETVVQKAPDKPVQKPMEKPADKPTDKPAVATTVDRTPVPAAPDKTEAPKPQPRANVASEQRGDAIQRAAQACDKQDSSGCIRRQLAKTENIDRIQKSSEQSATADAGNTETKTVPRERVTREPVRATAATVAPTPFEGARKPATPEAPASVVRETAAAPSSDAAPAKTPPAPVQRLAAVTEDIARLYRGH